MKDYLKSLEQPTNEYRATPFWSWNDKLDPEELRWQIREMHKAGLGGYFMHARGGLITEYLGDDWFQCIEACIDEGSKLGMDSWSYDEDGWPSGFGGGKVTGLGDEYHVRWLEWGVYGKNNPSGPILGLYTIDDATREYAYLGNEVTIDPSVKQAALAGTYGETIYFVCHNKNQYYVDTLNPKVVKAFIDSTYEEYYKRIGDKFGEGKMPGFFTDEPQFSNSRTPWSYILPEQFFLRYFYNPVEHLICLFHEVKDAEHFRYDYWKLVSDLYTKSFGKQIYDWCEAHGCKWTGHAMSEDNLLSQMRCTAGVMPIYEYMHQPGIDWLGRHIASPIIPRQVSSAARQLGKKFVLTETFALCGWDVSMEELKWIAEWQFVNGVNSICQHLEGYSIRGMRKRDYPPSVFYQSPWWKDYRHFNDYFARLSKLLADGEEQVDVLLLHPMHSAWVSYTDCDSERLRRLDRDMEWMANTLAGLHIPYHFGDETILERHGSVKNGLFHVGNCHYKAVVLPSMETIDETTYALLESFLQQGGQVVSIGDMPTRIDGRLDDRMKQLAQKIAHVPKDDELMLGYFSSQGLKNISITDREGEVKEVRYCHRTIPGGEALFVQNQNRYGSYTVQLKLSGQTQAVQLKLEDMSVHALPLHKTADGICVKLHFEPMQSYVILTGETVPEVTAKALPAYQKPIALGRNWTVEQADANAMTLDYVSYSLDDGKTFDGPWPVLDVMERLINKRYDDKIIFRYDFTVAEDADLDAMEDFALVYEYAPEIFTVMVNGNPVVWDSNSWWLDKAFHKVNIKPYLQTGENVILVKGTFYQKKKVYDVLFGENVHETERNKLTYDTEIESMYLVGDFGVYSQSGYTEGARRALFTDGRFVITNRNVHLDGGELVTQGYPFFRGTIRLSQEVFVTDESLLSWTKPYAGLCKLLVNDKEVGTYLWADYKADVSGYVIPNAMNKITFELVIGNRNVLGPHHHPGGELYGVAPHDFSPHGNYSVHSWRDRYCFVKVGMED